MILDDGNLKFLADAELTGKRVLVRVDFNVPLDENQNITDDTRIISSLPTINTIIDKGGIPILISHLGRPKGEPNNKLSLKPVAEFLRNKLNYKVFFADDCIGEAAVNAVNHAKHGDIVLLENLRFHKEETANDTEFARQLAALADVYVNDAFGTAHRAHASTYAVAQFFKRKYAGLLLEKEIRYFETILNKPVKPFLAILGGAKISGKIDVIKNLITKCDVILIGGGMIFTFLKAMGMEIGQSLVEEDKIDLAKETLEMAKVNAINIVLPIDIVVAKEFNNNAEHKVVRTDSIPPDYMGLDIGPETIELFKKEIDLAETILWNGPLGVFEMPNFAKGTLEITRSLAKATQRGAITVVGGGDSVAAIKQIGMENKFSHVSTGGGASLEYLEGIELPAITALKI